MAVSLAGQAQKVLTVATKGGQVTYKDLVERLDRRFGPGGQADTYAVELRNRQRKRNESLQELGEAIREITAMAYPDLALEAQERLAR